MSHKRNRPVNETDAGYILGAEKLLLQAREYLRIAGANHSADYVSKTLKSVKGASNHVKSMLGKQARDNLIKAGGSDPNASAGRRRRYSFGLSDKQEAESRRLLMKAGAT